ncbi:MAG TPA: type II secretion system F family protein [Acholeplasmataceae bacterium]|jgi:type IV pilus assembly protein PilC|nr:type II secretion system F family protein [Acholeplasmataceae bacterium]
MNWRYRAKTIDNTKITGIIEANDENNLRAILSEQKFFLVKAKAVKNLKLSSKFRKRLSFRQLANFSRQWSAMLASGVDIRTSLQTIRDHSESRVMKSLLTMIYVDISKGTDISIALGKFNSFFTPFFVHMIQIGEFSGNLPHVLQQLTVYYENEDCLERKLKQAFQYPKILLLFSGVVVLIISFFILPLFTKLFNKLQVPVPVVIRIINNFTSFFKRAWSFILFFVLIFILGIRFILKKPNIKKAIDQFKTKIPIYQRFLISSLTSKLSRALSILLQASVNLTDSFPIVIPLMANSYIESKLHSAFNEILKGTSFSQALKDANLFRSDFLEMVKVGEQSGELGSMLSTTTAYLDEQVLDNMHKLVALIEPSLIVLIAGLIIIIMSVVFFPLMNIMKYRF